MGDVLDLLGVLKVRRDKRQALRLRIHRRARELAERDQADYFHAMVAEIYTGRLPEEAIAFWTPIKGEIVAPYQRER
jgi:hypothetical protein